jgi:L-lactate dehydrogenase complex protein LldG
VEEEAEMSEETTDVLSRVRRALGRAGPMSSPPTPPEIVEPVARLVSSDIGLPELFASRAEAQKMHVEPAEPEEVAAKVVGYLVGRGLRRIALPDSPLLERLGVPAALRDAGLDARTWREISLDQLYDFDAGVTDVSYAVAETGSLVIQTSAAHGRAISLVPSVHVAIVEPKNCVADLLDLMEKLRETGVGNNATIITGPSKTADIEGALVVGVHGPGEVRVFLLK